MNLGDVCDLQFATFFEVTEVGISVRAITYALSIIEMVRLFFNGGNDYLPIQNSENMELSKSSVVVSPTTSPKQR